MIDYSQFSLLAQNQNARIVSRREDNGSVVTVTANRDPGTMTAAVVTRSDGTSVGQITTANGTVVELSGRELRTLLRVLDKHEQTRLFD